MDVVEELRSYLLSKLNVDINKDSITPDEDLIAQGLIDSLGMLGLVDFMEDVFAIKVDNEDLLPENFQNLNSLKEFIERKKKQ